MDKLKGKGEIYTKLNNSCAFDLSTTAQGVNTEGVTDYWRVLQGVYISFMTLKNKTTSSLLNRDLAASFSLWKLDICLTQVDDSPSPSDSTTQRAVLQWRVCVCVCGFDSWAAAWLLPPADVIEVRGPFFTSFSLFSQPEIANVFSSNMLCKLFCVACL